MAARGRVQPYRRRVEPPDQLRKRIAIQTASPRERGFSIVFFANPSGARMPDNNGRRAWAPLGHGTRSNMLRRRESPGLRRFWWQVLWFCRRVYCFGFAVIRKGAVMAVASRSRPAAIRQKVGPKRKLGGRKITAEVNRPVDRAAGVNPPPPTPPPGGKKRKGPPPSGSTLSDAFLSYLRRTHEARPTAPADRRHRCRRAYPRNASGKPPSV